MFSAVSASVFLVPVSDKVPTMSWTAGPWQAIVNSDSTGIDIIL